MSVPGPPVIRPRPRVTSTTYEVWWQPPIDDSGSPITGYILEAQDVYVNSYGPTDGYASIVGYLSTNVPYTFTVRATNANGTGAAATFRTVRLGDSPDAPTGLSSVRDASGVATISWTNPVNTSGIPLGWNVLTATSSDADAATVRVNTYGTDETLTIATLNPEKTYSVLVQGRNDVSYCPRTAYTAPITFGFVPSDISGLTFWLDATDLTSLFQDAAATIPIGFNLNGQPVGCWKDKSPSGKRVEATSVAPDFPTWTARTINSKYPGIRFTNTTKTLDLSGTITATTHNKATVCCVTLTSAGNPANLYPILLNYIGSTAIAVNYVPASGWLYTVGTLANPVNPFVGTQSVSIAWADTTTAYWDSFTNTRTDGSLLNFPLTGTVGYSTGGTAEFYVCEVLIFDRDLDATERGQLQEYLNRKWA